MKYIEPITISVSGIDRQHTLVVPISAKALEHAHLMDYEQRMGCLPAWNFQEAGHPVPAHINEQFASYRQLRAKGRT
jgi:hypothetical protein